MKIIHNKKYFSLQKNMIDYLTILVCWEGEVGGISGAIPAKVLSFCEAYFSWGWMS